MRGIHKMEDFDLVLGVINDKTRFKPVDVKRVENVVNKLDALYVKIDALEAKRRGLLNDAAILEEQLINVCKIAKSATEL